MIYWIEPIPVDSGYYILLVLILALARGADLLSTWIASPNLALEGNPIVRWLGWRLGMLANVMLCLVVARYPLISVAAATMSILVAARNFKTAWMMRAMGEERYLAFSLNQMLLTDRRLYYFCLFAECFLFGIIGLAVACYSEVPSTPLAVGVGIVLYAVAVGFYSCLSLWRSLRGLKKKDDLSESR
ncbi:MAG: hypothetical protein ACPGVU_24695 [Limisphaerales bacterium]